MKPTPRLVRPEMAAVAGEIAWAVLAHPAVTEVELTGTWPRSAIGPFGWSFRATAADLAALAADLPELLPGFDPLAVQWDRLSDHERLKLVLTGPIKVDLAFPDQPRGPEPPWRIGPDTLASVDAHFWDWTLWLVGKLHEGKNDRVLGELLTLSRHLLEPLGAAAYPGEPDRAPFPVDLEQAADGYTRARDRLELRYGLRVPRRLETEIRPLLNALPADHYRPYGLIS